MWQLAVDLGTSRTVAVLSENGSPPQVVEIDGGVTMPSGVYAEPDGRLLAGREAQRRAEHDPVRYEPHPTLRIRETDLQLGERVVPVVQVLAAVLHRVAEEVRHRLGYHPEQVLLTVPDSWGTAERKVLHEAVAATPWVDSEVRLVSAVLAAAAHCAAQAGVPTGQPFAVYDLGADGCSCAVLTAGPGGLTVLATASGAGVATDGPLVPAQLEPTVAVLAAAVQQAQTAPDALAGVFLVGDLSRVPLVAEVVGARYPVLGSGEDAAAALGAPLLEPRSPAAAPVPGPRSAPQASAYQPGPPAAMLPSPAWYLPPGQRYVPPNAKGSKGSGAAVAIACAAAAVVLLLVAGVVVVVLSNRSSSTETVATTTSPVETPPRTSSRTTAPRTPTAPTSVPPPPPVMAGWQTVAAPDRNTAYDVPPGWKVATQGTIGGFETKRGDRVVGKGYAKFGDDFCEKYAAKATSALTNSPSNDPAVAAREVATRWATVAFTSDATGAVPPLQTGEPRPVPSLAGKSGVLIEVSAPLEKERDCSAASASMYAFATPSPGGGMLVLVIYAARGVADAVSPEAVQQMVSSVRPL